MTKHQNRTRGVRFWCSGELGTDAGSAILVFGHAGDAVMLGAENLIVNDLANECAVLVNANGAPAG